MLNSDGECLDEIHHRLLFDDRAQLTVWTVRLLPAWSRFAVERDVDPNDHTQRTGSQRDGSPFGAKRTSSALLVHMFPQTAWLLHSLRPCTWAMNGQSVYCWRSRHVPIRQRHYLPELVISGCRPERYDETEDSTQHRQQLIRDVELVPRILVHDAEEKAIIRG